MSVLLQMKKMHRQMKHQKKFCKDETGRKRRDQDTWKVDDCKTCLCKVNMLYVGYIITDVIYSLHSIPNFLSKKQCHKSCSII